MFLLKYYCLVLVQISVYKTWNIEYMILMKYFNGVKYVWF